MSNRLAAESSPYLQQHADNPVDWYPWGDAAFAQARAQNKPVHLSVGYFACHWCHVMAHECFENRQIAQLLNEHFVNIKVDRQERPDIDDLYQRVVQMMGQSGGWPLTVFLTPEQEPFFAGTYFPPEDRYGRPGFPRLLRGLIDAWQSRQEEVRENCQQFMRGFQAHDEQLFAPTPDAPEDLPALAARAFARNTDPVHGGLGRAPKFPNVSCLDLMLRVYARTRESQLLEAVERTLDKMASGGIYDQLGGGFARYSVDERWAIPHFEKMLYDNGQLIKLYADAYRLTGRAAWQSVFEESISYVVRDLGHPEGGFFASEDADSEGEEGRFYAWSLQELEAVLGPDDAQFAARAYGVTAGGNFEHGRSVLQRRVPLDDNQEQQRLQTVRERLFAARGARVRPGRDENILTGWNALMIQGLCSAYQATGDSAHLEAARRAADFLGLHARTPQGGVFRIWRDGVAKVPGFLDDHGFFANALIDLYESAFKKSDLDRALELLDFVLENFWDGNLYFTARNGANLIHRTLVPFDSAWPSGASESVLALLRAHEISGRKRYLDCAQNVLSRYQGARAANAFGFAHLLAAEEFDRQGAVSIVFCGTRKDATALIEAAQRQYLPTRVLAMSAHTVLGEGREPLDGLPTAYVCRERSCLPPITSAAKLLEALR